MTSNDFTCPKCGETRRSLYNAMEHEKRCTAQPAPKEENTMNTKTPEAIEGLTALAETFDTARIQANAIEDTAWQRSAYGDAAAGLEKVLTIITGAPDQAAYAYQNILDGYTVREAIAWVAASAAAPTNPTERIDAAVATGREAALAELDRISAETAAQAAIDTALSYPTTLADARKAYDDELRGEGNIIGFDRPAN